MNKEFLVLYKKNPQIYISSRQGLGRAKFMTPAQGLKFHVNHLQTYYEKRNLSPKGIVGNLYKNIQNMIFLNCILSRSPK